MPIPNGGLITETNQQYYEGAQGFVSQTGVAGEFFNATFNTDLIFGSFDPAVINYALNNFKIYTSANGFPGTYAEYILAYTVVGNRITFTAALTAGTYIVVQLKILTGGKYGLTETEKAFGQIVEDNYQSYAYNNLGDIINNFLIAYVGSGKLIPSVKRTDVIFHAKRGLQEFSYDTLKSIRSAELDIDPSLNVILPQDYVNYVAVSWIDSQGVKRPIYPANNLTISPFSTPLQDKAGVPTQDNFGDNLEGTSLTEKRWKSANDNLLNGNFLNNNGLNDEFAAFININGFNGNWGRQYGLDPQLAQTNGWFNMNEREGKMSFSSNLAGRLIVLEYISDGLAYELDTRIPKMAEEALYAYIKYAILSSRINQPEYIIQRLKKEKRATLRNTKIRLSNIKLEEIVQVMRGKSKWIKH